jgi:plastocyanin
MPKPLLALLVAVVALAGCGDDESGGQKQAPVTVGVDQPIAFSADEYSFEPSNVTVKSGSSQPSTVRFTLRNDGSLAHDLHVELEGQDLGGTPIFGPGKEESGQASLAPGEYEFICTVGDHADLGMKGKLTVTAEK